MFSGRIKIFLVQFLLSLYGRLIFFLLFSSLFFSTLLQAIEHFYEFQPVWFFIFFLVWLFSAANFHQHSSNLRARCTLVACLRVKHAQMTFATLLIHIFQINKKHKKSFCLLFLGRRRSRLKTSLSHFSRNWALSLLLLEKMRARERWELREFEISKDVGDLVDFLHVNLSSFCKCSMILWICNDVERTKYKWKTLKINSVNYFLKFHFSSNQQVSVDSTSWILSSQKFSHLWRPLK